ncbi:MAG: LysR family transcriptional regulator [Clostridia bacterium]|nr:LysR family transcriptional regulator [Clostridia bacterium]
MKKWEFYTIVKNVLFKSCNIYKNVVYYSYKILGKDHIMELLQLRYFYDSAKTGSFAKTAEKFMVPPTSVSASVKRLEKELGCLLFDRSSNRIILNDNGKKLQKSLCTVFEELDQVVVQLSSNNSDTREIKFLVRAMRNKVASLIVNYRTQQPQVMFKLTFDYEENDYKKYDIIISEQTDEYLDYDMFVFAETVLRINASISSPLLNQPLTLKQLRNQPFITMGEQSNFHKILVRACEQAGFTPNITITTNDIQYYKTYIKSGLVLGLLRSEINACRNSNDLMQGLDVKDFNERQLICCYYKKQSAYGNVKHFLDFLKNKITY